MGGCHSCARILPKSSIAVLVPPCTPPDVFTDCFTGCLTPAACGWTLITPPTSVVFDGDMMIMASATDPVGRAEKPTLAPMPPAVFTVQFRFLEVAFPTSPGGAIYSVTITDSTLPVVITDIRFLGSGLVLITHVSGSVFSGPWVPAGLSTPHTVHYSVDGAGVPTLFVDGIPHPVAPTAPIPLPPQAIGTVAAEVTAGGPPVSGAFDWIMAATGIFPPTTRFCCPGGGPPT